MKNEFAGDEVERATQIALEAHRNQVRKDNKSPYVAHPLAVARILDKYGFNDTIVAAAILHDVLEDTSVTEETLKRELGAEITAIVVSVTEDKSLPWEDRKEKYIEQVCASGEAVMAVSVADKIHNAESLVRGHQRLGKDIWKKFNRGKEKKLWFEKTLLRKCKEHWEHPLLDSYEHVIKVLEELE